MTSELLVSVTLRTPSPCSTSISTSAGFCEKAKPMSDQEVMGVMYQLVSDQSYTLSSAGMQ